MVLFDKFFVRNNREWTKIRFDDHKNKNDLNKLFPCRYENIFFFSMLPLELTIWPPDYIINVVHITINDCTVKKMQNNTFDDIWKHTNTQKHTSMKYTIKNVLHNSFAPERMNHSNLKMKRKTNTQHILTNRCEIQLNACPSQFKTDVCSSCTHSIHRFNQITIHSNANMSYVNKFLYSNWSIINAIN